MLVRHGETVWHAENRYAGSSDIALTPRGEQQAEDLAVWARTAGLSGLHVSPLQRAQATIAPTARALAMTPRIDPRLREVDFGDGEGLTTAELKQSFPGEYAAFLADPVACFLPRGEPPQAAVLRGRAALLEVAAESAQHSAAARVLVVAHSTLIRLLLCDALGVAPSRYRQLFPQLGNTTLTELGFRFDGSSATPEISLLQFNAALPAAPHTTD